MIDISRSPKSDLKRFFWFCRKRNLGNFMYLSVPVQHIVTLHHLNLITSDSFIHLKRNWLDKKNFKQISLNTAVAGYRKKDPTDQ